MTFDAPTQRLMKLYPRTYHARCFLAAERFAIGPAYGRAWFKELVSGRWLKPIVIDEQDR